MNGSWSLHKNMLCPEKQGHRHTTINHFLLTKLSKYNDTQIQAAKVWDIGTNTFYSKIQRITVQTGK